MCVSAAARQKCVSFRAVPYRVGTIAMHYRRRGGQDVIAKLQTYPLATPQQAELCQPGGADACRPSSSSIYVFSTQTSSSLREGARGDCEGASMAAAARRPSINTVCVRIYLTAAWLRHTCSSSTARTADRCRRL